jgi:hypothetical protein
MSRAIDNAGLIHTCIASAAFATNSSEISKSGMGGRGLNHTAQSNFHLSQTKSHANLEFSISVIQGPKQYVSQSIVPQKPNYHSLSNAPSFGKIWVKMFQNFLLFFFFLFFPHLFSLYLVKPTYHPSTWFL